MKKLILTVLSLAAGAIVACGEDQQIDARFIALMTWAQRLSNEAEDWNQHCAGEKPDENCGYVRQIMTEDATMFVECARRYNDQDGDGCRSEMRNAIIAHELKLAQYNIEFGGKASTEASKALALALSQEGTDLHKKSDQCIQPGKKL